MMSPIVLLTVAVFGAACTAAAMPRVIAALRRRNVLDHPEARSSHTQVTVRGGGLGFLVGGAAASAAAAIWGAPAAIGVLLVALGLAAVGFVDDLRSLTAPSRLALQALFGFGVGGWLGHSRSFWLSAILIAVAVVWFVLVVNAVNFMDGINGITGITTVAWAASMVVLAWRTGEPLLAMAASVVGGAVLGFLPYNVPNARVFAGDVGSYGVGGAVAAWTAIAFSHGAPWPALLAPLLPYLCDVLFTLWYRWRRGQPLTSPHRDHLYQLFVSDRGWSHLRASGTIGFTVLALGVTSSLAPFGTGVIICVTFIVAFLLVSIQSRRSSPARCAQRRQHDPERESA